MASVALANSAEKGVTGVAPLRQATCGGRSTPGGHAHAPFVPGWLHFDDRSLTVLQKSEVSGS